MEQLKKNIVFYLLLLMDFYIVPWFIKDTGSAMLVMLVVIPLICFIISFFLRNQKRFWPLLYWHCRNDVCTVYIHLL